MCLSIWLSVCLKFVQDLFSVCLGWLSVCFFFFYGVLVFIDGWFSVCLGLVYGLCRVGLVCTEGSLRVLLMLV